MVQGDGGDPSNPAIAVNGGNLDLLYSTLGLALNVGTPVLDCSGGTTSLRNSLIVSQTSSPGAEIDCAGSTVETTEIASTQMPSTWFSDFASGDYSLTAAGQAQFADAATWLEGDPPFDFEGDPRPATDGSADYPGADVP